MGVEDWFVQPEGQRGVGTLRCRWDPPIPLARGLDKKNKKTITNNIDKLYFKLRRTTTFGVSLLLYSWLR